MVIFMWSANQWSILGIEVTTDISKIKAAYAKKAKLVHPEEYPEEFQELQKAYKSAIKYAKLQNTYKTTIENNKILSDKYISQDILEEQTISDKEIISKTEDIPQKETKIDRTVVLKSDNITSNNITKEERILNKDEISQPDNIAKEQTILNNDMILDSNNMKEEAISNKNVVLQLKDVSQKENISDKKIVLEPENIFDKKNVSSKKNITWKEIIPKHKQIVIDDEQEFVYDEISYEEKSQQCILDMICLAKNIYLINDIRCWEWFFNRDEYKELYKNDKFRLNFVETIQQIFGWTRKTLLYIQGFLKQYQKVSSRKAETNTIKWKLLKRPKLFDYMKAKQNNVTNAQKKVHDIILAGVKNNGYSGNINDFDSFLEYIRIYLDYAHNNMGRVEDLYQSGRNSTHVLTYIYAFAIIITILMLYGLVSGRNYKNTEQEKRIEQWDQERLENIEKWNQERLEKLKAEKESIRQLEEQTKEMMSTFTDEIDDIIK
ncbi:MAG: hypothetical protein HFJ03_11125 [Lachnospira sp.]|nr:hypothetical protein [Lachnospira sp.]